MPAYFAKCAFSRSISPGLQSSIAVTACQASM
jgi:hypothetical protein